MTKGMERVDWYLRRSETHIGGFLNKRFYRTIIVKINNYSASCVERRENARTNVLREREALPCCELSIEDN
jgi:hypothetical protein